MHCSSGLQDLLSCFLNTLLEQHIMSVVNECSDALIEYSLKLGIYQHLPHEALTSASCLNLQKNHTVLASIQLFFAWKGSTRGPDQLVLCRAQILRTGFFAFPPHPPWYSDVKFQIGYVVRLFFLSLHCLSSKCS